MKVLLAIEDTAFGNAIVDFVTHHRWEPDTEFRILHVYGWKAPERELIRSPDLMMYMELEHRHSQSLVTGMAERLKQALPEARVETEVLEGHAAERIVATATAWGADLVIMGSHGRKGIGLFLLGSVASAVVSHARCSVLIVRLPQPESVQSAA